MEKEELLQMLQMYKTKLANVEEQNMVYQVIIKKQTKEKADMSNTINVLQENLRVLTMVDGAPIENEEEAQSYEEVIG